MDFKIHVNCWELYNNGIIPVKWFDLEIDSYEDIEQYIKDVKHRNGLNTDDLELFIDDYEIDINIDLGESITQAFIIYNSFKDLDSSDLIKVEYLIYQGNSIDYALESYEDVELYEDMSLNDLAYSFIDEGLFGSIPESIANYIDYDAISRDLSYDYDEFNGNILRVA